MVFHICCWTVFSIILIIQRYFLSPFFPLSFFHFLSFFPSIPFCFSFSSFHPSQKLTNHQFRATHVNNVAVCWRQLCTSTITHTRVLPCASFVIQGPLLFSYLVSLFLSPLFASFPICTKVHY
jgi:hypothetical protein